MSWLGDVFGFEKFNLGQMLGKIKKDPERLFIGAADPFSSGVWGKILGKDYEPIVDQFGGASKDTYQKAQEAGINTGPGATMHGIARTIASMYAGGYGNGLLGSQSAATNPALIESAVGTPGYGASSASNQGLLGSVSKYYSQASPYLKQANEAMSAANSAKSLFGEQQQMVQPAQLGATGDPIGQLLSSQQQEEQMRRQMMEELRRRIYGAP